MASFGAKYPCFAPIDTEPETALPTYDDPVVIGRLVKADLSVNFASGKLYADDALAENVEEFSSGSIAMETDDMTDDIASIVYGADADDGTVTYKAGDSAPVGGLAYYKTLMRKGKKLYKGYYYPRVQATLGNDSAQTKGDNITFGTTNTAFTVFQCSTGAWRITKELDTELEAVKWVREQLGESGSGGGLGG